MLSWIERCNECVRLEEEHDGKTTAYEQLVAEQEPSIFGHFRLPSLNAMIVRG